MSEKSQKWLCNGCQFTLGYVESINIVRIKRKDLFVEVTGGNIVVNCCRCGKRNEFNDKIINLKGG